MSKEYYWTPKQIAQLTPAQQLMYMNESGGKKGKRKFKTMAEAQAFLAKLKAEGK